MRRLLAEKAPLINVEYRWLRMCFGVSVPIANIVDELPAFAPCLRGFLLVAGVATIKKHSSSNIALAWLTSAYDINVGITPIPEQNPASL